MLYALVSILKDFETEEKAMIQFMTP